MNRYTLAELAIPSTYADDAELATLARRVAEAATHLDMPKGDRKRLALAGGMADAVFQALTAACDAADAAAREAAADRAAMKSITLPGWTINIGETYADFSGPRDETVNASLRRHGEWVAASRVWRVSVSKGRTLVRSLKRQAGPAATAAREEKAQAARLAEIKRWLGYVEDSAREGRVYERGVTECRARTIADFADLAARLDVALVQARGIATERAARITAERAERETRYAAERAARAEVTSRRMLFTLDQAPAIGCVCRLHGEAVVYTGSGKPFRVSNDHPSIWGSHLLGHEGEACAYYYYRPATEAETADLAAAEAADLAAKQARTAHATEVQEIVQSVRQPANRAPDGSPMPHGLTVNGELTAYSGGTMLMLADDGAVWVIQGNGADGDNWVANNLPGAIGWRSTDPALIARTRSLIP